MWSGGFTGVGKECSKWYPIIAPSEHKKHLRSVPTIKYVAVSSIANSTAPIGAPNVTTVPAHIAAANIYNLV